MTPRLALILPALILSSSRAQEPAAAPAPRPVDLAICLDTSGSMTALIDAARTRIWSIVNELALADPAPRLRVALLAYGTPGFGPESGFVKVLTDFTEDLDAVSAHLFALATNGGDEFVGRVLRHSLALDWSKEEGLKLVVVAGNESADQDREAPFRDECRFAIGRGILVNALYCGPAGHTDAEGYREVARLADGHFAAIDPASAVNLVSPFDREIADLNAALNRTNVPFGREGAAGAAAQERADSDASKSSSQTLAQRAQAKSGALYWNRWCLLDALDRGTVKLEEMKEEDLPAALRGKSLEEQRSYLEAKRAERKKVQDHIQALSKQRADWAEAEMKKQRLSEEDSFDAAVKQAIRAQAAKKGYTFPE